MIIAIIIATVQLINTKGFQEQHGYATILREGVKMSKKSISVLVIFILVLSSVLAGDIVATIAPYSFQNVNVDSNNYGSTYGFAISAGYRHRIWKDLSAGGDLEYGVYRYKELEKAYNVIGLIAKADWTFRFGENMSADAGLGLGMEWRIIGSDSATSFCMEFYGDYIYEFTERIAATAGLDLRLAFQNGSSDFTVMPAVGCRVKL